MQRISVVGTTCSGKSTLAGKLAKMLDCRHVELDALHWEPGWIEVPDEVMRIRAMAACEEEKWVVDGNYACVRDVVWGQADTVIWLDFSMAVVLWRSMRRTFTRAFSGEPCCNGNRETIGRILSHHSIILWAIHTHGPRRRKYPPLLKVFQERGGKVIRLTTPADAEKWLKSLVV